MQDFTRPTIAFISAQLSTLGDRENLDRHNRLIDRLVELKIRYQECEGCYQGVTEKSVSIPASDRAIALSLAREFDQESVLIRRGDGVCELVTPNGNVIGVGTWRTHGAEKPEGDYTQSSGRYYSVEWVNAEEARRIA